MQYVSTSCSKEIDQEIIIIHLNESSIKETNQDIFITHRN